MADQKISAMPSALALTGEELVPLVQSGVNVQTTVDNLTAFKRVYGAWSDNTDQAGSVTAGTAMLFNTTDIGDGITLVDSTKFTVPVDGIYNFQFSAQLKNTDNSQHDATIWIRVNGLDVSGTGTQITVTARKSAGVFGYAVAAWNYFLDLNADDYVELYWLPTSTLVTVEALPASVSPAYPSIPSVIATMNQVG